jgi:hypothetical protein
MNANFFTIGTIINKSPGFINRFAVYGLSEAQWVRMDML